MPGKRRECGSYSVFRRNLGRADAFLRVFDEMGGVGQPSNERKELLRGAVVFAIGALDAFLHDLVLELIPTFGVISEDLSDALRGIAKEDPSLALRVALAPDTEARRNEFSNALDAWLSLKSFQGPEAVTRAAAYVGHRISWDALDAATGLETASSLTRFTQMRHDIVHRGRKPYVRRRIAKECIDLVAAIAKAVNQEAVTLYH